MDTWKGVNRKPITLNKYTYADSDPVNHIDPSGKFSLAGLSISSTGNVMLATRAISIGLLRRGVNQAITATIKQSGKLATHALKSVRACIRKKNKCGLQANLLIVGSDNRHVAQHISDAQTAQTVVLTYQKVKKGNRQWYRNQRGCRLATKPTGYQCDEYRLQWK